MVPYNTRDKTGCRSVQEVPVYAGRLCLRSSDPRLRGFELLRYPRSPYIYMPHRGPRTRAIWWQEEALYSPSSNGATQEPTVFTDFWALGWSSFRRHVIIMLNYTPMARAVHGSCQEDPVSGDLWVMDWSCLRTPCICPPVISGINLLKKPLYVHTSALG